LASDYLGQNTGTESAGDQLADMPAEQAQDEAYAPTASPITDDLKQAIAEEVQRQLSSRTRALLNHNNHFHVSRRAVYCRF
jgi:DNA-binding cell septation regulator SpoVG